MPFQSCTLKIYSLCPGWCGSVDWVPICKSKGHWFDSQLGLMPSLWVRPPVGGVQEATTHWCFSPSFSPSLSLSLKINLKKSFSKTVQRALAGVAEWIECGLRTKGSPVQFPVRVHAWVAGQVPSRGRVRGNHILIFLSLSFPFPLSKNK